MFTNYLPVIFIETTCLVNLTNNGQVRFIWQRLQIDAQQTCCWNPEIVVEKNDVIRKEKKSELTYICACLDRLLITNGSVLYFSF